MGDVMVAVNLTTFSLHTSTSIVVRVPALSTLSTVTSAVAATVTVHARYGVVVLTSNVYSVTFAAADGGDGTANSGASMVAGAAAVVCAVLALLC